MPYASQRDRNPELLEIEEAVKPAPPLSLVMRGISPGVIDLSWEDPAQLSLNAKFEICGVNIYRSFDSEFGPFERITGLPLGATFWRDQTDNVVVPEEDVTNRFILNGICEDSAEHQSPRYVFRTQFGPIVKPGSQAVPADSIEDVKVFVDGVEATLLRVIGFTGEVEIDPTTYANVATQKLDPAVVPTQGSRVTCSYRYNRSLLKTNLAQRIFYRVTTVGLRTNADPTLPDSLVETSLEQAASTSNSELEKLDYIWKEAIRRNRWILDMGGERVKAFIQKQVGLPCGCIQDYEQGVVKQQPLSDCLECFGTGIVGGYEGPYELIIAPDDAERRKSQRDIGRTVEHTYEVWASPTPLLSQRDFIVKINGDRYSVGAVRMPSNRGMVLQQHFMVGVFDQQDIRYRVPLDNPFLSAANRVQPVPPEAIAPDQVTDKGNIPDERELRGRTVEWENTTY